jgi:tRNA U54 and U55 pseudouridine synthase Pus10
MRCITLSNRSPDIIQYVGRYVKEFVHGDLGRTHPSIGHILGCVADILQLDVVDVSLEWPPKPGLPKNDSS